MTAARLATLLCSAFLVSTVALRVVAAQGTGAVAGRAVDEQGRPVAHALVRVDGGGSSTRAADDGAFRLLGIRLGTHTLVVTSPGFAAARQRIDVRAGETDTVNVVLRMIATSLAAVIVREQSPPGSVRPAEDLSGTQVLAGMKSEVLQLANSDANLAEKTPRQIFAKVPGVFVYDMDGTGNQVNISTRGLDAHRSWEMNVRQDGVLVNSDIYGYPAAHYSPPMEAMERLELIRGTAALQYGSQFGGLVNYLTKKPDTTRVASFESINSAGSFGLLSTFNSVGGRVGRVTYHGYISARESDGYRKNSRSESLAQFLSLTLQASPELSLRAQLGRSTYRYQIPGPLTDAMFSADPRQATRSRNYFSPDIVVPSLLADWSVSDRTRLTAQISAVLGDRSSVQFIAFANVPDAHDPQTGEYAPRQVDIDGFRSITGEVRLSHSYSFGSRDATLATGLSINDNDLHRRQQGRGTRGADYDLTLSSGTFGRDIHYRTDNVAMYVENMLHLTPRWSVVPGVRIESGITRMTGTLSYLDPTDVPTEIEHRFPLFGVRTEYQLVSNVELYGGWSQAYRPMILKDVLPESAIERIDPDLRDAKGWTLEAGARGLLGGSTYFDVSAFALHYDNRFGALLRTDAQGQPFLFKTNTGSSLTRGLELGLDVPIVTLPSMTLRAHTATSYFDAEYRKGSVRVGSENVSIVGNRVESVPKWISRSGLTARLARASVTALVSSTSRSFADPENTVIPTANGARGLVRGHTVADINGSLDITDWLRLRAGVSNILDKQYFTKRPQFYPGPGVWPSDGRSLQTSVELRR